MSDRMPTPEEVDRADNELGGTSGRERRQAMLAAGTPPGAAIPAEVFARTWDEGAEQAVLAAALLEPEAAKRVMALCQPGYFYREQHRAVFEAMQRVHGRGEPVDLITVCGDLRGRGQLHEVGGPEYLTHLFGELPTAAHVVAYVVILHRAWERRSVLEAMLSSAGDAPTLAELREALDSIGDETPILGGSRSLAEHGGILHGLDQYLAQESDLRTRPHFGIPELDRLMKPLPVPGYSVMLGDSGMGKTTLALTLAIQTCIECGIPTGIYSAEMGVETQLGPRLAYLMRRSVSATADELHESLAYATTKPLYLYDRQPMFVETICEDVRRLASESGVKLVVVDYLQLVRCRENLSTRERVERVSADLKALSIETGTHVCALSQVTWDQDKQDTRTREGQGIEHDADVAIEIRRHGATQYDKREGTSGTIYVRKHRYGRPCKLDVDFNGAVFTATQRQPENHAPDNVRGADRA